MDPNQWYGQPYGRLPVPQQPSSLSHSSQLFDLPMIDQLTQQQFGELEGPDQPKLNNGFTVYHSVRNHYYTLIQK